MLMIIDDDNSEIDDGEDNDADANQLQPIAQSCPCQMKPNVHYSFIYLSICFITTNICTIR